MPYIHIVLFYVYINVNNNLRTSSYYLNSATFNNMLVSLLANVVKDYLEEKTYLIINLYFYTNIIFYCFYSSLLLSFDILNLHACIHL